MSSWLEHLEKAKAEPYGTALLCKSSEAADSAKRQLYAARAKAREAGNKSFDSLSISMSPHSDEILFIYHSKENLDEPSESPGTPSEPSNT